MPPKTRLDAKLTQAIVKHVEVGAYADDAAEAEGVGYETYRDWLAKGTGEDGKRPGNEPYRDFVDALRRARAISRVRLVKVIADGDTQDRRRAKGAAWILERTYSRRFGAVIRHKVEDELKRLLEVAQGVLERDQYRKLCEALNDLDQAEDADVDASLGTSSPLQ